MLKYNPNMLLSHPREMLMKELRCKDTKNCSIDIYRSYISKFGDKRKKSYLKYLKTNTSASTAATQVPSLVLRAIPVSVVVKGGPPPVMVKSYWNQQM